MTRNFTLLLVLLLAVSVSAFGQLVDPATFHTGNGVNGTCPTGIGPSPCAGITSGEVLPISGTNFDIFQEAGNSFGFTDPLVLIVAVPNTAGVTLTGTEITSATEFNPYNSGGSGTPLLFNTGTAYGLGAATFDQGGMTSSSPSNVYDFLGGDAAGSNNSDSFGNFNTAYAAAGLPGTPTSYEIYTWAVHIDSSFTGNSAVDFVGTLPVGTFILAFGEEDKTNGNNIVTSQFTNTGEITSTTTPTITPTIVPTITPTVTPGVPEPNSIVLFGSALLGACALLRRKLIRS